MSYRRNYPATVAEVLNPPVRFRPAVLEAVKSFARSKPYRGDLDERKEKFRALHAELCRVYGKRTRLVFGIIDGGDSGTSHYCPATDEITLYGKLSVVTSLHEFAHALGRDERGAVRWSVNLFRECFPTSFAPCAARGHMPAANRFPSGENERTVRRQVLLAERCALNYGLNQRLREDRWPQARPCFALL